MALNKLRLFFRGKYFSFFLSQFDIIFHVVVILDTKDIVSKNQTVFFPQNSKHSSVKDFWGRQKKSNCNSPWSLAIIIYICRYPVIGFGMLWCSYFWESIFCRVLSPLNRTTNWKAVDFSNCTHAQRSKLRNKVHCEGKLQHCRGVQAISFSIAESPKKDVVSIFKY